MKIGFIGLGNMGGPMCRNLLKNGHALKVYDVVPELVRKLKEQGCEVATSRAVSGSMVEQSTRRVPGATCFSSPCSPW